MTIITFTRPNGREFIVNSSQVAGILTHDRDQSILRLKDGRKGVVVSSSFEEAWEEVSRSADLVVMTRVRENNSWNSPEPPRAEKVAFERDSITAVLPRGESEAIIRLVDGRSGIVVGHRPEEVREGLTSGRNLLTFDESRLSWTPPARPSLALVPEDRGEDV